MQINQSVAASKSQTKRTSSICKEHAISMKNSLHSLLGKEAKSMTMKQNLESNLLTDLYKAILVAMQISIMAPKILK
jgi:hypothetical protein